MSVLSAVTVVACGGVGAGGQTEATPAPMTVIPSTALLPTGGSQGFVAAAGIPSVRSVTWNVVEGPSGGAVSSAGVYLAPALPGTFHVRATSTSSPDISFTAVVSVVPAVQPLVAAIYPTIPGGREWYLPDDADLNHDSEFAPDQPSAITIVQGGRPTTYHTDGAGPDAEIRLNVHSPAGKAWWRNLEMTAYYRVDHAIGTSGPPHTELEARGAFHTTSGFVKSTVNDGVMPPPGTVAWPWWDAFQVTDTLNGSALGSSYHGNLYLPPGVGSPSFWGSFEKELSHTQGYCGPRGKVVTGTTTNSLHLGQWFGEKFVIRNSQDGGRVKVELWLDAAANGTWVKISEYTDQNGAGNDWSASAVNGIDAAPYSVALNQLITWAGPYAGFRADNASLDFKLLSVREIDPY
jgi:hypothetical protein